MKNDSNQCPWAVLMNPGQEDEEVYAVCATFGIACEYADGLVGQGRTAVVMKRFADGSLAAEF